VPGCEAPLLALDEEEALACEDEEVLLRLLRMVEGGGLPGREHLQRHAELREHAPAVERARVAFEDAASSERVVLEPDRLADGDDEPAVGDRCEPGVDPLEPRLVRQARSPSTVKEMVPSSISMTAWWPDATGPGLTTCVRPTRSEPRASWMWPHSANVGWARSMKARTASLPTCRPSRSRSQLVRAGGACGQKIVVRQSATASQPRSMRRASSSSSSSYGVRSGDTGAAETPNTPTSPNATPRESSATPSSSSRASIAGESMFPETARSRGTSPRQPSIARAALSGLPPVVMSPPMTSRSTSPIRASISGTARNRSCTSTAYAMRTRTFSTVRRARGRA